jgi:hypothetical protein
VVFHPRKHHPQTGLCWSKTCICSFLTPHKRLPQVFIQTCPPLDQQQAQVPLCLCVTLLGFMSLVAVACVHLDQPKAMALSLGIASTVISIILILIGLTVETHSGTVSVNDLPLRNALLEIDRAMVK